MRIAYPESVVSLKKGLVCLTWCCSIVIACVFSGCAREENITSLLNLVITDSPVDAKNVSAVNIVISDIEWKKNGDWHSIQYLEDPIAVDIFSLTGNKLYPLISRYVTPGRHTEFRFTMQVATKGASLTVTPQSDIQFVDGTTKYLYWFDDKITKVIVKTDVDIPSRQFVQFVVDFDLRKSIRIDSSGDYILEPIMRIVDAGKSGNIDITATGLAAPDHHIIGYAYLQGKFSEGELTESKNTVAFGNAITSGRLNSANKLILSFLEAGKYELVFATHNTAGKVIAITKKHPNVSVEAGETTTLTVDMK